MSDSNAILSIVALLAFFGGYVIARSDFKEEIRRLKFKLEQDTCTRACLRRRPKPSYSATSAPSAVQSPIADRTFR